MLFARLEPTRFTRGIQSLIQSWLQIVIFPQAIALLSLRVWHFNSQISSQSLPISVPYTFPNPLNVIRWLGRRKKLAKARKSLWGHQLRRRPSGALLVPNQMFRVKSNASKSPSGLPIQAMKHILASLNPSVTRATLRHTFLPTSQPWNCSNL